MPEEKVFSRSAASDLWRNTLSRVPTVFGKLVYLTSLRDANSGHYAHHGLAAVYGEEEAHQALRQSHEETFAEWLRTAMPGQQQDLTGYLDSLDHDRVRVLKTWAKIESYRNLVPDSARDFERDLFLADLETILALMRRGSAAASNDPDA